MFDSFVMLALTAVAALAIGGGAGFFLRQAIMGRQLRAAAKDAAAIMEAARAQQKELVLAAKEEAVQLRATAETDLRERRTELQRQERRLIQKEENIERKSETLERRERTFSSKEKEVDTLRQEVEGLKRKQLTELERISGLSRNEARDLLLEAVETEFREEASRRILTWETLWREEAEDKARRIVATAVQRCATDVVNDIAVSVVPLPSEEMKGRIIGREGRNIRALENATGVDIIIDDTPDAVTISCFDPVRREVARLALSKLVLDGRIHPARIEEMVKKSQGEVENAIRAAGEQAAFETSVPGLHPEVVKLLGRLKYRYSYGQNVLAHSVEVAHLAGLMASEIGANIDVAKKAGLIHDLGKAVDHEVEGPHAIVGAELAKRYGKSPEVVSAIAAHHGEKEMLSVEDFIVAAADGISGARPGARRESLEHYIKRLEALEDIANSFAGVEKSFAIQAGREIRIMVKPEEIDDLTSFRLARDIAKKVQESLEYPGQIKVTVIRETRAVEYAK